MPSLRDFQRENIQFFHFSPWKLKACEAAESLKIWIESSQTCTFMRRKQRHMGISDGKSISMVREFPIVFISRALQLNCSIYYSFIRCYSRRFGQQIAA